MKFKNIPQSFLDYCRYFQNIDRGQFITNYQYKKYLNKNWVNLDQQQKQKWKQESEEV